MTHRVPAGVVAFLCVLMAVVLVVGLPTVAGAQASGITGDDSDNLGVSSIQTSSADQPPTAGLEGDVTTQPIVEEDGVIVGTERGVYVLDDGTIETFVDTDSVVEIVVVADNTAVVLTDNQQFPNINGIDLATGFIEWELAHERETYSPDLGHVDRQVPAFDVTPVEAGSADVAVAAGEAVIGVDATTGDQVWKHTHDRNVWSLTAIDDTVHAGTQSGSIIGFDSSDGTVTGEEQLVDPSVDEIPHAVWDLATVSVAGTDHVAATAEEGTVGLLNPTDGEFRWDVSIAEYDEELLESYYRGGDHDGQPTLPGDALFRNIELTVVDAAGGPYLAVEHAVSERPDERRYEDSTSELHLLAADSGETEWETEELAFEAVSSIDYSESIGGGGILAAEPADRTGQELTVLDITDGTVAETLTLPAVAADPGGPQEGSAYVDAEGNQAAVVDSDNDLLFIEDDRPAWSIPTIQQAETISADFTGDGVEDILVVDAVDTQYGETRGFVLRSGDDGSVVWTNLLDPMEYTEVGGLEMVQPVPHDSGADVTAIWKAHHDAEDADDRIVTIDGATGDLVDAFRIIDERGDSVDITSIAVVGDIFGDDMPDAIVGDRSGVSAVSLHDDSVELIDEYQHGESPNWLPFEDFSQLEYHAIESPDDNIADIVAVEPNTGDIATIETALGDPVEVSTGASTDIDARIGSVSQLADLTTDEYQELAIETSGADSEFAVYEPATGSVPIELDARSPQYHTVEADLTGDGSTSLVVSQFDEDPGVNIYAGTENVWSTEFDSGHGDRTSPADVVGDVTGDGTADIALVERSPESGVRVSIYESDGETPVSTFEPFGWEDSPRDPVAGAFAEQIPDQTGDGEPELVIGTTDVDHPLLTGEAYHILDPEDETLLASGSAIPATVTSVENSVGILRTDGSMSTLDPTDGVSVTDIGEGSELDVSWTHTDSGVTAITIADRLAAFTDGDSATLRLPNGDHDVRVQMITADGVVTYALASVSVDERSYSHLIVYALTVGGVGALFAIHYGPAVVRRHRR